MALLLNPHMFNTQQLLMQLAWSSWPGEDVFWQKPTLKAHLE
jgi:hypothetical protein